MSSLIPKPESWEDAVKAQPGAGMTVVLSTKYGGGKGIFFDASVKFEEALIALGCKAYNPNRKLKQEGCSDAEANDVWLRRFMQEVLQGASSEGFVLQIQEGDSRSKSNMQFAEEDIARLSKQPVLGVYLSQNAIQQGFYDAWMAHVEAWCAIDLAKRQWATGVLAEVESVEDHPEAFSSEDHPRMT